MVRIILVFIWILGCGNHPLTGQKDRLLFHHLRVQDGLSQAENAFIFKDARGFVWISSLTGLNRFDGTNIKVYSPDKADPSSILGENIQSQFFEDTRTDLWFCTYDAINRYNWDRDCFDHIQILDNQGEPRIGYYIFYLDQRQHLWFLLENQFLYTYHIPSGELFFKGNVRPNSVRAFVGRNASGLVSRILLMGRDWLGVEVVDIDLDQKIKSQYPLSMLLSPETMTIQKIIMEADTVAWILTPSALIRYSLTKGEETLYPILGGEDMVSVSDFIIYIGTSTQGLIGFDTQKGRIISHQRYTPSWHNGLASNSIHYLTCDRDGTLWVSSSGVGVSFAHPDKGKFSTTLFPDQLQTYTNIIPVKLYEDVRGFSLCFTKDHGVMEIRQQGHRFLISPETNINRYIPTGIYTVVKDAGGRYWVSTWSGIFVYDPEKAITQRVTEAGHLAFTAYSVPDGSVLMTTTRNGLYKGFKGQEGRYRLELIEEVSQEKEYYPVILDHKGRIWLNESLQQFVVLDSSTYVILATLPINGSCQAMAVSPDSSTLWLASSTGLYEVDADALKLRMVHTQRTGLPAVGIRNILVDRDGKLWLTHYSGIIAFDPERRTTRSYTVEDGLPALEFTGASCVQSNGEFWFGSVGGFTRFFPDQVRDVNVKAIPQITELLINDQVPSTTPRCALTGATHITEIQKLCFDYDQNGLSFMVHALEYSAPEFNKVLYQMEGLDEYPVEAVSGTRIRYPNLQPGTYTFVLHAMNSDSVINPDPRELVIVIYPPFYRTWWFALLTTIFAISIIAYIIYLRFSKKLELQKIRLKLYENLHDDVGSRLTAIVLSAEDLEQNEQVRNPKLQSIAVIAKSIVDNMRRLVWAIDPENDKINSILQKIKYDHAMILGDSVTLRTEIEDGLRSVIVPGEIRYQISSICSEAFNNIAKYAHATELRVKLLKEKGQLRMTIEDNGKGFNPEEQAKNEVTGSGYGLTNMNKRANRVGGKLKIYSKPGEGTRIEVVFPFRG